MTLPGRWIVAGTIATYLAPIQYALDPAARAVHRLGLGEPVRLDGAQHRCRVDVGDRHVAEGRIGVSLERREKLRAMLRIAPLALVLIEVALRRFVKRQRPRLLCGARGALRFPVIDRIDAVKQEQLGGAGTLAGSFQRRDDVQWPEPHPTLSAVAFVAEQPRLLAVDVGLQVKPMAIVDAAGPASRARRRGDRISMDFAGRYLYRPAFPPLHHHTI